MSIREKGYTHWEGEFEETKFPWKPITRQGIRLTFKKKFFKFSFFLTLVPALVSLAGIYVSERLEDFPFIQRGDSLSFLEINPNYFKTYFTNEFLLFMIITILIFCGAGLISDDLKYNSLQLYFSRPIKKKDYFLGKAAIIAFFLLMVTFVPGVLFIIMKLLFSGSFQWIATYPWLLLSVAGYSIFVTSFFALYTLFLSSISKNRRYVAILIFGIYFFSHIAAESFYGIFQNKYFSLLSVRSNLQQIGAAIFVQKPRYDIHWIYSVLVIFALCLLASLVLRKKIQGVVIVK